MAEVVLRNLKKEYPGGVVAVNNINLTIEDKEFLVLVGPSGCGKTTTLRMIAGLEKISGGEILVDGTVVNKIPPDDRDIAIVFQDYVLYPHMTVYENMAFGLKQAGMRDVEAEKIIAEVAKILGLDRLLDRLPMELSGGQKQRVALGRAIVRRPKAFLMDEPLSNLDPKLRAQMRAEIKRLQRRLKVTTVYVTHDQQEAMTMGDRITLMRDGVIQQHGPARELYDTPINLYVATFLGNPTMNVMNCEIVEKGGATWVSAPGLEIKLLDEQAAKVKDYVGKTMIFGCRPEDFEDVAFADNVVPEATVTMNVDVVEPMGANSELVGTIGSAKVIASVEVLTKAEEGKTIELAVERRKIHLFDKATEVAVF